MTAPSGVSPLTIRTRRNRAGAASDWYLVQCDRFRESASARLDGEPIGMSAGVLDHHLTMCVDCARWLDEATRLTRFARLGTADVPDLAGAILDRAVLPARRVLRQRTWLRVALGVVGTMQLALGLPSLFGGSIDMTMTTHGAHESAAWNVALGVALIATGLRPRRTAGLVPVLGVFVAVLATLSVPDVVGGTVAAGRLATHLATVAGLVLVLVLDRVERAVPPPGRAMADVEEGQADPGTGLRGVA